MSYNKTMLRVCAFASTDETRPALNYCVHDEASKALVATDGHRAIWDRSLYSEAAKPFKAKTYLKTSDMIAPDWEGFKYPAINSFRPNGNDYSDPIEFKIPLWWEGFKYPAINSFRPNENDYSDPIEFKIPLWIGKLKGYKKDVKVWFTIGGCMSLTSFPQSACINIALLVPLADETVTMRFKMTKATKDTPSVVDNLAPVWIILDDDCDMVVMPMRG
jgi:hypothetical protein